MWSLYVIFCYFVYEIDFIFQMANCSWASGLTSLGFSFLICQMCSAYLIGLLSGANEVRV